LIGIAIDPILLGNLPDWIGCCPTMLAYLIVMAFGMFKALSVQRVTSMLIVVEK
jgi:hypothetical protein